MRKEILLLCLIVSLSFVASFNWDDGRVVVYYDMGDTSITDLTGHGYSGTNNGADSVSGLLGNAINFSGFNSDYVLMPNISADLWTINASMNVWVKMNDINNNQHMWAFSNKTSGATYQSGDVVQNQVGGSFGVNTFRDDRVTIAQQVANNSGWNMITVTQTTGTNGYKVYVNGTLINQSIGENIVDGLVGTGYNWQLGRFYQDGDGWLYGNYTIDEFGMWNRTLNTTEITELYNGGLGLSFAGGGSTVTLNSPADNLNMTNGTIEFNATVTPSTFSLTNATFYIWFSNGTTVNTTTTTSFTGNTTAINISIPMFNDSYVWNVKGCQGNGIGVNCSFASSNFTFNIKKIFERNQTYTTPVVEQTSQTFKINVSMTASYSISSFTFIYNETNYSGSFNMLNSTDYQGYVTIIVPNVVATSNLSFRWFVALTDGTSFISNTNNQTVSNFGLDNCSVNTIMIHNFTLADEQTQVKLNNVTANTSIKVNLNLYANSSLTSPLYTFSQFYNQTNPAAICVSAALGSSIFYETAQIEYTANNYATEFYNIQGYILNATSNPSQNITLYDLLSSQAQVFKINYRDASYLPVSNALIQIGRLYVDEGTTKTVEIPITDPYGSTIANLELNDVIYTFTVTKNGEILGTFPNSIAICQNPTITNCEINLNSLASNIEITNFSETQDFAYTLTYNNNTRTISSSFIIPSGASSLVTLNVTTETAIETSICSTSVTSSSGTLNCIVPASFGNTTVRAELYKAGVLVAWGNIDLQQTPKQIYGANLVFLSLIIFLTLVGAGVSDNPIFMVMSFIVGVFLLILLNLIAADGFIGGGATVLYLIIAIIIIVIKGVNRN